MTAVDTNILVYAHRGEFQEHPAARRLLSELADGPDLWGMPVFCLAEFLRVVTHPAILDPPSALKSALAAVEELLESASLRVLLPGNRYPELFLDTVARAHATGNLVFDAQIVALCREHGVETIWSNDHDLTRFSAIKARPLP